MTDSCSLCDAPIYARGWCQSHYSRWHYLTHRCPGGRVEVRKTASTKRLPKLVHP
jgi:hypothetical protein